MLIPLSTSMGIPNVKKSTLSARRHKDEFEFLTFETPTCVEKGVHILKVVHICKLLGLRQ